MSRRLSAVTTTTIIDHHLFLVGTREYPGERLPSPHLNGDWVTVGRASVLVESPYDNLDALLRLEEWDGEPEPAPTDDRGPWDDVVTATIECPDEAVWVNQITAGCSDTGFSLTRPGRYRVRLACRNGAEAELAYLDSLTNPDGEEASLPEEYLVQFWPAVEG